MHRMHWRVLAILFLPWATGCATLWQANAIEDKVDRLLANTQRETLTEIFGTQAREIATKIDGLEAGQKAQLDEALGAYQRGSATLDEVRAQLVSVLGGTTRVVASQRGIWVRDVDGEKLRAIARNSKIEECQRLDTVDLPSAIAGDRRLARFTWGQGLVDGATVYFPWELTMSTFTKEIVENTARRTAQEFLRLTEGKGWNRPVYIRVSTENPDDPIRVSPPGVEEVYVVPEPGADAPAKN
ncbi:MAG: hypothetical protein AAFU79_00500 [Myxococcota bacterium]